MLLRPRLFAVMALIGAVAGTWWYWQWRQPSALTHLAETIEQTREVITPPPLRGPLGQRGGTLTIAGVLAETNRHRAENNLKSLAANTTLHRAAQNKLNDMFTKQYFDHVGPDGKGPADWVEGVGYRYIRVGENLALGNFADDADLVQAWMDSPGHRANILHTGFSEIGIAVGQGTFEGQRTWLAVQTFALPSSACPTADSTLAAKITALKTTLATASATFTQRRQALEQQSNDLAGRAQEIEQLFKQAQEKIEAGNAKIAEGNRVYQKTGSQEEAQPYWDDGKQLQQEGEVLLAQAKQQQEEYNQAAAALRQAQEQYNQDLAASSTTQEQLEQLITTYNQQVKKYNACAQ